MELLAPPPIPKRRPNVRIIAKAAFAVIFLVLGFDFSSSAFFREYPLFGVSYLAELLISVVAGLFGFYTFPKLLLSLRYWIETLVTKTIYTIVADFWEHQSKKIDDARKARQVEQSEQEKKDFEKAILVDTSVLIDGRILDIVRSGFLDRNLIVLQDVIKELQAVSDSKDKIKRQRGRNGLDILNSLKKHTKVIMTVALDKDLDVDLKLVDFAKAFKLSLFTMDFNLMKVAKISNVKVLNINSLVESLKTVLLPGEELEIEILQKGKEKKQGIGYLEDGTMVVVEDAVDLVSQKVKVIVSKVIQSKSGKMFFCVLAK